MLASAGTTNAVPECGDGDLVHFASSVVKSLQLVLIYPASHWKRRIGLHGRLVQMAKIITCLLAFMLIAAELFSIRARRLDVSSTCAELTHHIQQQTHKLWDQQVLIAQHANPEALSRELKALTADTAPAATTLPDISVAQEGVVVPQPITAAQNGAGQ